MPLQLEMEQIRSRIMLAECRRIVLAMPGDLAQVSLVFGPRLHRETAQHEMLVVECE